MMRGGKEGGAERESIWTDWKRKEMEEAQCELLLVVSLGAVLLCYVTHFSAV